MFVKSEDAGKKLFLRGTSANERDTKQVISDRSGTASVDSPDSGFASQSRNGSDSEETQLTIGTLNKNRNSSLTSTYNHSRKLLHLPRLKNSETLRDSGRSDILSTDKFSYLTYDIILDHIDSEGISDWIATSNEDIKKLSIWISSPRNFCEFCHVWLSMSEKDQKDALKKEYDLFYEQFLLTLSPGMPKNNSLDLKLSSFMKEVIHEYPDEFCEMHKNNLFLNCLSILTSKEKSEYKKLLADVRCRVAGRQHIQNVLAIRSFALIRLFSGVVFSFEKCKSPNDDSKDKGTSVYSQGLNENQTFGERILEAIRLSHTDVVEYLLESNKVRLDYEDKGQKSLFFHATVANNVDTLKYLLGLLNESTGHLVNKCAYSGNSPLHTSVNMGHVECARSLLASPFVDVNRVNVLCHGATPLHLAVLHDRLEIVELLLESGADPTITMNGVTPVQMAREAFSANSKIVKLLDDSLEKEVTPA